MMSALSGKDLAFWNLQGTAVVSAILFLLGGRVRDKANVYSYPWTGGHRPAEVEEAA